MPLQSRSLGRRILVLILWIVPVLHPLLLPLLGVACHLLPVSGFALYARGLVRR